MRRQASASFFEKKEAKKLLFTLGYRGPTGTAPVSKKSFAELFFRKATTCL
jgi:hypothetical protein